MKRKLPAIIAIALCIPQFSQAQTTETFEGVTASGNVKPTTFISNSQSFTITTNDCVNGGVFGVWIPSQSYLNCDPTTITNASVTNYGVGTACTGGTCTGTSAKFIDNGPATGLNQIYSIKTTNSALFTIKSMFVYLSADLSTTPSAAGGITVIGKIAGNPVFTYTKTTGFNTSVASNNGFTYLDFSSGTDYTATNIDEVQIQGGNIANYVAIDNFRWGISTPLPLGLLSFNATQNKGEVQLDWTTNKEFDIFEYQVERSNNGKEFANIMSVQTNQSGVYRITDASPLSGNNFYRLKMVSKDGASTYSDVKNVSLDISKTTIVLYPNPTKGILLAQISDAQILNIRVTDFTGRVVKTGRLSIESNSINLETLKAGMYFYQLSDAVTGSVIEGGKISKL